MHKPRPQFRETAALRFWRALDAELRAIGDAPPGFAEAETLFVCGYSVPQAFRALAPHARPALRLVSSH